MNELSCHSFKKYVWLSVDPLAHEFPSWTPYHYVHNNPVNMIEPDGKKPWPIESKYKSASRVIVSGFIRNMGGGRHGAVDIAHLGSSGQIAGGKITATRAVL